MRGSTEEDAQVPADADAPVPQGPGTEPRTSSAAATGRRSGRAEASAAGTDGDERADIVDDDGDHDDGTPIRVRSARVAVPLVSVLAVLLVLLMGGLAFLWFTRPDPSGIRTETYAEALQAARSAVVDFTSFDHLTFDDDVEQVRRISTEEFAEQSVASLEARRQEILDLEAVVNTEIIGAGVTTADEDDATVALLIQTTRQTNASEQADVVRFSIQVTMERPGDRWLLASIAGTGSE